MAWWRSLPERDETATEKRLIAKSKSAGKAPPAEVARAIEQIQKYCAMSIEFSAVPLDLSAIDPFRRGSTRRCSAALLETTTYGELAKADRRPVGGDAASASR